MSALIPAMVACFVIFFAVGSVLFFIVGLLCGYFGRRRKQSSMSDTTPSGRIMVTPYDDVQLPKHSNKMIQLKLNENPAYEPTYY